MNTTQTQTYAQRVENILNPFRGGEHTRLIADIAATACEYEDHHHNGRHAEAARWLAEYERLTAELGFDPLA